MAYLQAIVNNIKTLVSFMWHKFYLYNRCMKVLLFTKRGCLSLTEMKGYTMDDI